MRSVQDIADGALLPLDFDDAGAPRNPLVVVDLDSALRCDQRAIGRATAALSTSLAVSVGVAAGPLTAATASVAEVLTFTLGTAAGDQVVALADLDAGLELVRAQVAQSPVAAVTAAALLRQTADLDVRRGLVAESAAYSMLLAGAEFRRWLAHRGAPRPPESEPEPVLVEREDAVLRIRLHRPARRNAIDAAMRDGLVEALTLALADPGLTVDISGDGPHFCSGGDLDEFGTTPDVARAHLLRSERNVGWLIHQCRERVVVRVQGECIGAGVELAAFAGRVLAAPGTTFRLPELSMGLLPGAGGTVSVTRRVGRWRAGWLALTGAAIDTDTALQWGLVDGPH